MCTVTSFAGIPRYEATSARPLPGVWLGDHTSTLPSLNEAAAFCGSSGACEMNGKEYATSTTLAALFNAASTSPSVRKFRAGLPFENSSALRANSTLLCVAEGPSSQVILSFLRAEFAAHQ